jgi:Protein of unknwon function (DUF3310)
MANKTRPMGDPYPDDLQNFMGMNVYNKPTTSDFQPVSEFKFDEDEILTDIIDYIEGTYSQHYSTEDGIQAIDVWQSLGTLESTSRDTAIKYLMRYGKKDGKNIKDLYKAVHYIVLMIYENNRTQTEELPDE